jgi:hypothetical protein
MGRKQKLGSTLGVKEWQDLATVADCRRLLRWLVISMRDGTLDRADAGTMGQLACHIINAIRSDDLERRVRQLEQAQHTPKPEAEEEGEIVSES